MSGQDIANLYGGLSQVTSIAVNWLNSDVYLTTAAGTVEKITVSSGSTKLSLLSGRSSPRHLVLDAEDGLVSIVDVNTSSINMDCSCRVMYWIEGGDTNAIIYKAALDGSNIVSIATNVNDSQDLSVDVVEHRVYWNAVSGAVYQILSAAEDGSDITTVYDSDSFHSASISVFEDYIYSAKETTQFIFRVDKYTRQSELSLVVW